MCSHSASASLSELGVPSHLQGNAQSSTRLSFGSKPYFSQFITQMLLSYLEKFGCNFSPSPLFCFIFSRYLSLFKVIYISFILCIFFVQCLHQTVNSMRASIFVFAVATTVHGCTPSTQNFEFLTLELSKYPWIEQMDSQGLSQEC